MPVATYDFTRFLQRVRERVARSLRDGGYARAEGADRADLYGTAAAIGILAATGDRPRGGRAMDLTVRVRGWQEADGRFSDPTHGDLHRAATGVATLALLGDPPEVPAFADELLDATVVDSFLEGLDWSHPWPASHQAAGLLAIGVLSRADDTRRRAEWLSAYTSWLDANVDQRTGLWRGGQMGALADDPGLFGNLGCSFHVHFLYSWLARPWPVPSGVVDTGLALYSKPGAVVGPEHDRLGLPSTGLGVLRRPRRQGTAIGRTRCTALWTISPAARKKPSTGPTRSKATSMSSKLESASSPNSHSTCQAWRAATT